MPKYRKRPEIIEAVQFFDDPDSLQALESLGVYPVVINRSMFTPRLQIIEYGGVVYANVGDYIVKGARGLFIARKTDFEAAHTLLGTPMTDGQAVLILNNHLLYSCRYEGEDDPDNEAFEKAITAITTLNERMTPMPARREIAKEPTREVNGGLFGKGTTIWFCPKCGTFNTPTHKFCWKCGQALSFDTSGARAGTRAGEE
jgi:hypothetical protein